MNEPEIAIEIGGNNESWNYDVFLVFDYQTFIALGFDGYDVEHLRAFLTQAIEQGKIAIRKYPRCRP